MAFILLSEDCNMFMPLPLCPITRNFGILNDDRPTSTPETENQISNNNQQKKKRKDNLTETKKEIIKKNKKSPAEKRVE